MVRLVGRISGHVGQLRGSGQRAAVEGSGGDGTGVHQRHIGSAGRLPGLLPSRLGKFRVEWRMEKAPLAGTSPAPKQGPQKQLRTEAPAASQGGQRARSRDSSRKAGMEPG